MIALNLDAIEEGAAENGYGDREDMIDLISDLIDELREARRRLAAVKALATSTFAPAECTPRAVLDILDLP